MIVRRVLTLALLLLAGPFPAAAATLSPLPADCHGAKQDAPSPTGHDAHQGHLGHQAPRHPDPRPRVTARRVLDPQSFGNRPTQRAYAVAREIPRVLDGLHCYCGCAERDGLRSLLSCFESDMASTCGVCQDQAMLAHELHRSGRDLGAIRTALDAKYGG